MPDQLKAIHDLVLEVESLKIQLALSMSKGDDLRNQMQTWRDRATELQRQLDDLTEHLGGYRDAAPATLMP